MTNKRIYLKRSETIPYDKVYRPIGFIDGAFTRVGDKQFEEVILEVKSAKTGNTSRFLSTSAVEIENMPGIYRMTYSEKMIRKNERVFNHKTGVEYLVTPICRTVFRNYVVYILECK